MVFETVKKEIFDKLANDEERFADESTLWLAVRKLALRCSPLNKVSITPERYSHCFPFTTKVVTMPLQNSLVVIAET